MTAVTKDKDGKFHLSDEVNQMSREEYNSLHLTPHL
jgi:hypothetical protein